MPDKEPPKTFCEGHTFRISDGDRQWAHFSTLELAIVTAMERKWLVIEERRSAGKVIRYEAVGR